MSVITLKAFSGEAVVLKSKIIEFCRVLAKFIGEIPQDEEDGGKSWSREGQEEEVSRK